MSGADVPLDVSDNGLFELADQTVRDRCDRLGPKALQSEINFVFARFVRIRDRVRELGNRPVRIWSFQKNQWWRPNSLGYTYDKKRAGLYDRDEAEKIVESANIACEEGKLDEEIRELDE